MPRAMKATMTAATNATGTPIPACRIDGRRSHQSTQTAAAVPTNAPPATSSSNTGGLVPSHRPPNAPQLPSVTRASMYPAQVTPTVTPATVRNAMNAPFASTAPGVGSASLTTNTVSPAAHHVRSTRRRTRPHLRIFSLEQLQVRLEIAGTYATSTARLSRTAGGQPATRVARHRQPASGRKPSEIGTYVGNRCQGEAGICGGWGHGCSVWARSRSMLKRSTRWCWSRSAAWSRCASRTGTNDVLVEK